jgi:hypothetical protein
MATVSTVKNITIAYNPNDFFYVTALNSDDKIFNNSNNTNCSIYETPDAISKYSRSNCSSLTESTDKSKCYNTELCINKSNAKKINSLQTNHDGSSERRNDKNVDYNRELLRSYNLGIGIVGVGAMFYFFYK